MDKCQKVRKLIADYRTGMLGSRKESWILEHIEKCSECAIELQVFDDVSVLIKENSLEIEPPEGLWNGVHNGIMEQATRRSALGRWLAVPLRVAVAGAAALVLIIGIIIYSGSQRNSVLPVRMVSNSEYIQGHALYAGQSPLADRISYLSIVAASSQPNEAQTK